MTLSFEFLCIMRIMTQGMTLSKMTLNIRALKLMTLCVMTLAKCQTERNDGQHKFTE
jgi:hypothetical protein